MPSHLKSTCYLMISSKNELRNLSKIYYIEPTIHFDIKKPRSLARYAQSKLVIHNYLGTSYLETLYLNIPTIVMAYLLERNILSLIINIGKKYEA